MGSAAWAHQRKVGRPYWCVFSNTNNNRECPAGGVISLAISSAAFIKSKNICVVSYILKGYLLSRVDFGG